MARTGRRAGDADTREDILRAARTQFATAGYRGATIRAIAAEAGVDPALVHHYFGTKRDLFVAVVDLPLYPEVVVDAITAGPPEEVGERVVRTFLGVWSEPDVRERLLVVLRGAVADEIAARMLREFLVESLLAPVAQEVARDRPMLRASLVASQLVGYALLRYVLELDPIVDAAPEEIVGAYAGTVQRYLTGDLAP